MHTRLSSYVRVASLTALTFYFPSRVMRQFGKVRLIPAVDTIRPEDKLSHSGNAIEWEKYWEMHSKLEVTPLARGDHNISAHYRV